MDLSFSPAEEAFRAELRAWLAANLPPELPEPQTLAEEVAWLVDWQRRLAGSRWVGVHWPQAYGGRGASIVENYIFQEEMARSRAPEIINRIGVNLVGPTLIHHRYRRTEGTLPRQAPERRRDLVPAVSPSPNAGSDLTALRCKAERDGDAFVVNGQKCGPATRSFAHWGILLARTDPAAPKAKGISFSFSTCAAPALHPAAQANDGK